MQKVKEEWIKTVNNLFQNIDTWVAEDVREGLLEVKKQNVKIEEEGIGTYKIQSITLKAGRDMVEIRPIARIILGGKGRVDLIKDAGRAVVVHKSTED